MKILLHKNFQINNKLCMYVLSPTSSMVAIVVSSWELQLNKLCHRIPNLYVLCHLSTLHARGGVHH